MHFNTFDLIRADPEEFVRKVKAKGLGAVHVKPGGSFELA